MYLLKDCERVGVLPIVQGLGLHSQEVQKTEPVIQSIICPIFVLA